MPSDSPSLKKAWFWGVCFCISLGMVFFSFAVTPIDPAGSLPKSYVNGGYTTYPVTANMWTSKNNEAGGWVYWATYNTEIRVTVFRVKGQKERSPTPRILKMRVGDMEFEAKDTDEGYPIIRLVFTDEECIVPPRIGTDKIKTPRIDVIKVPKGFEGMIKLWVDRSATLWLGGEKIGEQKYCR